VEGIRECRLVTAGTGAALDVAVDRVRLRSNLIWKWRARTSGGSPQARPDPFVVETSFVLKDCRSARMFEPTEL